MSFAVDAYEDGIRQAERVTVPVDYDGLEAQAKANCIEAGATRFRMLRSERNFQLLLAAKRSQPKALTFHSAALT